MHYRLQALHWRSSRSARPRLNSCKRLKSFHGNDHFIGMDFAEPKVDFTALAKSMGMPAEHITEPDALGPALRRSFSTPGPKLLDVVVDGKV